MIELGKITLETKHYTEHSNQSAREKLNHITLTLVTFILRIAHMTREKVRAIHATHVGHSGRRRRRTSSPINSSTGDDDNAEERHAECDS